MRNKIRFIKSTKNDIHFCHDINGLKSRCDLWLSLDSGLSLFQNIEKILKGFDEAHNVTNIIQINDFDFEVEYNQVNNYPIQEYYQVRLKHKNAISWESQLFCDYLEADEYFDKMVNKFIEIYGGNGSDFEYKYIESISTFQDKYYLDELEY